MFEPIRILIADDHPLFRGGVAHSLESEPDMTVVGEADNGEEAFELAQALLPDILLLDIAMPGQGGISTLRRISAAFPSIRVMMLTVSENEDNIMLALKAGARGYALKGILAEDLARAVRAVSAGEVFVSPIFAGSILCEMARTPPKNTFDELTKRECEVLKLVTQGLMNREVALQLSLSEKTVKSYMSSILQKLQVRNRVEAALMAQRHGLVDAPEH